jgi:hypothetical protein
MFTFMHYELGQLEQGSVVEVALDSQAYVRLFDESNFRTYRSTGSATGIHVLATESPVHLNVPGRGRWHIAIDFGGGEGQIRSSINVLAPVYS